MAKLNRASDNGAHEFMLEKIFGTDKEEKLEDLESEIEKKNQEIEELKKELEKEQGRAKEAITEKQKTDKKLKEAKHKIESLEDRIRNLERESKERRETKEVIFLQKEGLISLIDELASLKTEDKTLTTHYVENPEEAGEDDIVSTLQGIESETGYILLQDKLKIINLILTPPLPIDSEFYRDKKFRLEKLREMLKLERTIGFISAHAGKSALGLIRENEFEESRIIESEIKGKHSKGGFSQGRFERSREEQIQMHLKRIAEEAEEILKNPDYVILNGNDKMISNLDDQLTINASIIKRSLDIGNVRRKDFEDYLEMVFGARIYIL